MYGVKTLLTIATTLYAALPKATVLICSLRVDISATSEKHTCEYVSWRMQSSDVKSLSPSQQ